MKTNNFLSSHLRPTLSDYNNFARENPATVDPDVPVNVRVRRTVSRLTEIALIRGNITPLQISQRGAATDQWMANFLNNVNLYNGIQQQELNQLLPRQ